MKQEHWFDQYRQTVKNVVMYGLDFPQYEDKAFKPMVAAVIPLLTLAQKVGLSYKDDLIMSDPVYCVADLFIKTKEGWELSLEIAVLQTDFMEYEAFMEDLASKLQKMERFHYPGEMAQYRPTGESLRDYLDTCVATSPWKATTEMRPSDFIYGNDEVDMCQLDKQYEPKSDTYTMPIVVQM